ncbi:transglycosylase domain-containing protein [Gardnerella greenwoodii]|uniref:Carboxypeptidase n=1 Tax=Gardnerella greenwoodii TaxID=2914925 RepID=A0A2N6RYS3_9BIFI|nr:transglycosylase domain-containing protein [Gardnerella greenwoodii]MDF0753516.1 penicillin-binding protein [Gardnerella greenwoodii]PMC43228.1 carboxypeptidase [Gardnerella greenwoodii]
MPKKNSLTARRVLALFLTYITLCVAGGVAASIMFVPGVMSVNSVVKTVVPSLRVDGIDFDVTALPQKSRLYAADGKTIIATFYAQNRTVVPLRRISQYMQQAMVAREDRRFFEHSGVDVQGVMRAFVKTFVKKSDMQGGSSLTQQYVKNVLMIKARENNDPLAEYHASEGTIARKLREMLIAIQMEKKYSKLEILQGYLNIAQFGSNNIYGVETAAHRYFNTSAAKLNLVQAATIAAITKNPSHYDPSIEENQPEAQKQRNIVLDLMLRQGFINQKEHDSAVATPLKDTLNVQREVSKIGCQAAGDAAFFCDYVTKRILHSREFGKTAVAREKLLTEGGLDIYTTMDLRASKAAMKAARDTIPVNDKSGFEVSIAAIKPGTGEVLAFGSNRIYDASDAARSDPTHTALNYAVDERDGGGLGWQIGSTWKPINMVAWMLAGKSINQPLRTTIRYNNSDFNCNKFRGVGSWFVQNSGGGTVNPETPLQGLVRSHNTTQASMAQQIKLCSIADAAKILGYHNSPLGQESVYSANSLNPPMTIGSVQASPLTVANVYATLGADGVACDPIAIKRVIDKNGKRLRVPSAHCHQAIPKGIAQTAAYALNQGVVQPGGEASTTQLDGGRKTFAKTGTNEQYYMTTAGFVPYQVASFVAVGNAESQKSFNGMTINGRTMAAWYGMYIATPAWKQFMNDYLKAANIPVDNDYGKPDPKYTAGASSTHDSLYKKPAQTEQEKRDEDARRQAATEQQEEANKQQQTQDQYGTARRDDYSTSTGDGY